MVNTSKNPYNDDFNFSKNFKKILFKPGLPVQTRELNQVQSIFKGELGALADHIFKNGSKVSNCRTSLVKKSYVRLMDVDTDGNTLIAPQGINVKLVGESSGVEAILTNCISATDTDPYTIYVHYTKTGSDNEQATFIHGENIIVYDDSGIEIYRWTVRCPSCPNSSIGPEISPTGSGYYYVIDEGIIYYNQMFIHVDSQELLVAKYIQYNEDGYEVSEDTFKIGLDYNERVLTALEDASLYDNSLGYPNAGAEGADRLVVSLTITRREYDSEDGERFILLAKVQKNYNIEYTKADSEYNDIMKEFARRTYEQSGNFTVTPYRATFLKAKKDNSQDTLGWSLNGDESKLVAVVTPGIAYVSGERVTGESDIIVQFDKARDTETQPTFATHLSDRQYVMVDVKSSNPIVNNSLDTTVLTNRDILLFSGATNNGDVSGTQIGVLKCVDQGYVENNIYMLYVYGVTITDTTKSLSQVKSLKTNDGSFVADAVLTDGSWKLYNSNNTGLVYKIPVSDVKTLRSIGDNDNGSIVIQVRRKLTGTTDASGNIQFNTTTNESFVGYNPYYNILTVGGAKVSLSPSQITITNNTITLALGTANAGKNIVFLANVNKFDQKEKTKVLTAKTFTTTVQPSGNLGDVINLGVADGYKLTSVKIVNPSDSNFNAIDCSAEYEFITGQTPMYYGECQLKRTMARANIVSTWRLEVSFTYFEHSGSEGYFTVDSYSQLINSGDIAYENLPIIKIGSSDVRLSECIDFRSKFINNSYEDPVVPAQGSTLVSDMEYYLPRVDVLQLAKTGVVTVKKGNPSMNPKPPVADIDNMIIYEIHLKAYTYSLKDVNTNFIDNKRYTMKDISSIEKRLSNLEYYTSLNMLEQKTVNMNITDANGNTRFKNGFIVDNFTSYAAADINNKNFRAALDRSRGELRPSFKMYNADMVVNKNLTKNVKFFGNVAMLPYNEVSFLENNFATKHISINPYMVYVKKGSVMLSPNIDTWSDDENLPEVVTTIDSGTEALKDVADKAKLLGTDWSSWVDLNTTVQKSSNTVETKTEKTTTNTTTTVTNQQRTMTSTSIDSRIDSYSVEDVVKDVKIVPYIRTKIIEFYASKMKPNTKLYVFFDGVNVTAHCRIKRPVVDNGLTARDYTVFGGAPIVTDADGEVVGEFRIPPNTFFTGEKTFVLTDDPAMSGGDNTTSATTKYFAGGVSQTKQTSTLNIVSPVFSDTTVRQNQSVTSVSRDVSVEVIPQPPVVTPPVSVPVVTNTVPVVGITNAPVVVPPVPVPSPPRQFGLAWDLWWGASIGIGRSSDPVAQAFTVPSSCFITRLDLFFKEIDLVTNDNVWVELRTMINGYPSTEVVARKDYKPSELLNYKSDDSTKAFPVIFDIPVYIDSGKSYCFVVGGYSPDTRVWVSRLGDEVINIPGKIVEEPPSLDASFRSLNGSTWNAEQFEFIKYRLYRAEFVANYMEIVLENDVLPNFKSDVVNPIEIQSGVNRVRLYVTDHGVAVNDRVSISLLDGLPLTIEVSNSTPPQVGQVLETPSGKGTITEVTATAVVNTYEVLLKNVSGILVNGESYHCEPLVKSFNTFLLAANGNKPQTAIQVAECQGFVRSDITDKLGYSNIGNVDISAFNKEHIVVDVDSANSFIVEIPGTFTKSGRFGSNLTILDMSRKYDTYNISAEYMSYGCAEDIKLSAVNHSDYTISNDVVVNLNADMYTGTPLKLASPRNENRVFGNTRKSSRLSIKFTTSNGLISPVVNTDAVAMTLISNNVGNETTAKYNVTPNATNRFIAETSDNGSESYRYIMQKVSLVNPAADLKIYFDVYKDINADFDVYVKAATPQDTHSEDQVAWVKLDNIDKSVNSGGIDDFIEYELSISENCTTWAIDEFVWYIVKIVGKTTNSSKPPIFKNLRAIAIT